MSALPRHSSGNLSLHGGVLQWRWSGQCSQATTDAVAQQLQQRKELLNTFFKRQEDMTSLFIQALVQAPAVAVVANSQDTDTLQNTEFGETPTQLGRACEEDGDGKEQARLHGTAQVVSKDWASIDGISFSNSEKTLEFRGSGWASPAVFKHSQQDHWSDWWHEQAIHWMHWYSTVQEPERQGLLARFECSSFFHTLCVVAIIANTWLMIQYANFEIQTQGNDEPRAYELAETCFLGFYIFELVLKLFVHRMFFFFSEDKYWNMFDAGIILSSCANALMSSAELNLSFVRTFRLLKLSKIFRVLRIISFLRDLRVMVQCVVQSFMPLFWCFVLLALIMLIFAIYFVQSLAVYLRDHENEIPPFAMRMIDSMFPSVQVAMVTLNMVAFAGIAPGDAIWRGMKATGYMNSGMLMFFVAFFNVSLFNIVCGLFVEKAMKYSRPDDDAEIREQRKEAMNKISKLRALIKSFDADNNGTIERHEFMLCMDDPIKRYHFAVEGLDIQDGEAFFDMLEHVQGNTQVDIETFVDGCCRMAGHASSVDLQALRFELRRESTQEQNLIHQHLDRLDRDISRIDRAVNSQPAKESDEGSDPPQSLNHHIAL